MVQHKDTSPTDTSPLSFWVEKGVMKAISAFRGRKAGNTLYCPLIHHRADTYTLTPRGQFSSISPCHLTACLWTVGGNWGTWTKPMQTWEEHTNSKQKGPRTVAADTMHTAQCN